MKIAVAGTGYVGLSIATLLSQHNEVMAVDIIPEKVNLINSSASSNFDQSRYCPHRWQYPWYSRSMQTSHLGQTENMFSSR